MPFSPFVDEGNSFDDYFSEDMYKLGADEDENNDLSDPFQDPFSDNTFNLDQYKLPSVDISTKDCESSHQQRRWGTWCLEQRQSSPRLVVGKIRRLETKRPNPIQVHKKNSLNHTILGRPPSPLELTSRSRTKRFATFPNSSVSGTTPCVRQGRPPISRETTLSPSPMYANFPISSKRGNKIPGNWQEDFQNFHLRPPYDSQAQAPTSNEHEVPAQETNAAVIAQNGGASDDIVGWLDECDDADFTAAIAPFLLEPLGQESPKHPSEYNQDSFLSQLPPTDGMSLASGSLPSLSSSNSSQEVRRRIPHRNNIKSTNSQAADLYPPLPTLAPEESYPALLAPTPQRITHPIIHQGTEPSLIGLGIEHVGLEQMNQPALYESQTRYRQGSAAIGSAMPYQPAPVAMHPYMTSYPPLPLPPPYPVPDSSLFLTPRKQRRSASQSPTRPTTPSHISPRRHPHRSPTRNITENNHHRRKSLHKTGPIRDTTSQDPLPTPRSRSASRPRAPKTPSKPPAGGGGTIDFVNFTPKDSAKLLSDVAPSGSSKTRARRELEAREKRKKISEAALKAVQVAGGDVAVFEKAIVT